MTYIEGNLALKQFGIDPHQESRSLEKLSPQKKIEVLYRQMRSYDKESVVDRLVSPPYFYWFDLEGNPYKDPELKNRADIEIDEQERGGIYKANFGKVMDLARNNPHKVVLWYSPIGPACFENDGCIPNKFRGINYVDGQLYLNVFDGQKVNSIAIKVTKEVALDQFIPANSLSRNIADEKKRIQFVISHPEVMDLTLEQFLDREWLDVLVYTDHEGKNYSLVDVLLAIQNAFIKESHIDKSDPIYKLAQKVVNEGATGESVFRGYLSVIKSYMDTTGKDFTNLAGACGGAKVARGLIDKLLEIQDPLSIFRDSLSNLFSSEFRLTTQTDYKNDPNLCHCGQPSEAHFHCPLDNGGCGHPIIVGKGINKCPNPNCGKEATCK